MEQQEIIDRAYELFSSFERPLLFTRISGDDNDPECRDHDNSLMGTTRHNLSISQIGPGGYSPVPNFTPKAMAYFLPRPIELAVQNVSDVYNEPFIIRFLNSVLEGPSSKQFELLKDEHEEIVYQTLLYAKANYSKIIEEECWADDLEIALSKWERNNF